MRCHKKQSLPPYFGYLRVISGGDITATFESCNLPGVVGRTAQVQGRWKNMQDKKHLKVQGIRFARSLQTLLKMVNMFSADHKSTSGLLQRTYELLNPLVKQSRCLKPLENEFLKRGIGAVTFDAGITLTAFREAIACIGANPKVIEENGGLLPFLEQRNLEFVRIFPASKTEKRNEEGDTILEMGSEEFLISKALTEINGGFSQGIDAVLSHMEAAANGGGAGDGSGFGAGTGF